MDEDDRDAFFEEINEVLDDDTAQELRERDRAAHRVPIPAASGS
jgi:hypothetical protein